MASALAATFPSVSPSDRKLGQVHGGRIAAGALLADVKPQSYERSRNYLAGDVTRLSAYLRYGVLTLAEVRDQVLRQVSDPRHAGKLINELAWRDYWQRIYSQIGDGIWQDREPYKTGFSALDYKAELPADIVDGATTLACMDGFAHQLRETGYLHNHARMWFAAYVVHWRRVRWQAGARWFLEHLIDGDPASNNLSWQWVASTFASKAYIFNRENLERYTDGEYCRSCPHAQTRTCPFEQDYESLEQTLFPSLHVRADPTAMPTPPMPYARSLAKEEKLSASGKPLLWVHTDSLNPESPMFQAHPDAPCIFIWDTAWIAEERIALKRIVFIAECLMEMPVRTELRAGEIAAALLASAQASGADYILAQRTPDPRLRAAAAAAMLHLPVVWYDPPPFVEANRAFDLKRFSRYWQRAQSSAMTMTR